MTNAPTEQSYISFLAAPLVNPARKLHPYPQTEAFGITPKRALPGPRRSKMHIRFASPQLRVASPARPKPSSGPVPCHRRSSGTFSYLVLCAASSRIRFGQAGKLSDLQLAGWRSSVVLRPTILGCCGPFLSSSHRYQREICKVASRQLSRISPCLRFVRSTALPVSSFMWASEATSAHGGRIY